MADNYPSVGLRIDLNEIAQGNAALDQTERKMDDIARSADQAAKRVTQSVAGISSAERNYLAETIRAVQNNVRMRVAETQRGYREETQAAERSARTQRQLDDQALAFRIRMARQRTVEAEKEAAAERRASQEALNTFRRTMDERIAAGRRAADERIRAEEQVGQFQRRMTEQRAREAIAANQRELRESQRAMQAMVAAERAAHATRLADFRSMVDQRMAIGRAAADAQNRLDQTTFDFQRRMWAQRLRMAQEEARQSALGSAGGSSFVGVAARGGPGLALGGFGGGGGGDGPRSFLAALNPLPGATGRIVGALRGLRDSLGGVRAAFFDARTAVGVFLGGLVLAPIVRAADSMVALEARIGFFAQRASDVPYLFEAVYATAQRSRAPLEAIATLYTRLAPLAERLGKSQTEILRITETVAKGVIVGGATPAEAASSSQQLAQALASNRLGGDELRSLAENAPILLAKIAAALDMNTGEFIKWAQKGNANAKVMVEALEEAQADIDRMFAKFPVTIGQSMTLVGNAFTYLVGTVDKATGASQNVAQLIANFAGFLGAKSTIDGVTTAVNTLGEAMRIAGTAIGTMVDYLPALAASLGALLVVRTLAVAWATFNRNMLMSQAIAAATGNNFARGAIALNGMAGAAASARAAFGALLSPLNLVFAAITAGAFAYQHFKNAQETAARGADMVRDSQEGAVSALDRAVSFVDAYGGSTANLKKLLDQQIAAQKGANAETAAGAGANDAATEAARRRMDIERMLTVNILRRAAADAMARGAELRSAANTNEERARQEGAFAAIGVGIAGGQEVRDAARRRLGVDTTRQQALGEYNLATDLYNMANEVRTANLNPTVPGTASGGGGGAAGKDDKGGRGLDGAINRIAKMRAEVEGLRREIDALSADPLSAFSARIIAAGNEAAAQYTAGKATGMAEQARTLGMQKEELTIRKQLTEQLIEQTREEQNNLAQARITADGARAAHAAMTTYLDSGVYGYARYQDALDAAANAESEARQRNMELAVAQQYGVETLDQIAAAYQRATGASEADAIALQNHAKAAVAAAKATDDQAVAEERLARLRQNAINARERRVDQDRELTRELELAEQTAQVRAADARARVIAEDILADAMARGVRITDEEALARARVVALVQEQAAEMARLKISIQDDIRNAFIETGKLDFTSLKQGVTRALRQAVYDALLAKPINMVVNAVVNVATKGLENILSRMLSGGGGAGGLLGMLGSVLGMGGRGGSYSQESRDAMDALVDSVTGFRDTAGSAAASMSKAASMLQNVGQAFVFSQIGSQIAGALGARQNTGSMIGGLAGGALGFMGGASLGGLMGSMSILAGGSGTMMGMQMGMIGGPIGAIIGAALGAALGGLLGGKPTNAGAGIDIINNRSLGAVSGNKRTEETEKAARAAAEAIIESVRVLSESGITVNDTIRGLVIGGRDASQIYTGSGQTLTSAVGDPQAAADTAMRFLLQGATYVNDAQKKLVESMLAAGSSFDDIAVRLQEFAQANAFMRDIRLEILRYQNPQQYEIERLKLSQDERRKQLGDYRTKGLITDADMASLLAQLAELERLELADVMKQFAGSVNEASEAMSELKRNQERIAEFVAGLRSGPLSPYNPRQQVEFDSSRFYDLLARAQKGDAGAMGQINDVAQQYLTSARDYLGSTEAYADIFHMVEASLQALSTQEFQEPQVAAISQASTEIQAAIVASGEQVAAAINAGTEATVQQLAAQTEAIVNTTAGGFGGLTAAQQQAAAYQAALAGGFASY